jgi:predicted DCC family thiol-disulfide oxidoreductase YuxK
VFFGLMAVFFARRDYAAWSDVSRVFWQPVGIVALLHLPVLPRAAMAAVAAAWKVLLVLSALGAFTRVSTAGAFVLGTYLLGIPESFGKIHHADAILVWAMAVLALSRCGDGCSVDALVRAARRPERPLARPSGEYTWPIRMMWLVMSVIFFCAGVSKLRHSGLRWVTSDALATYFVHASYGLGAGVEAPPTGWALRLAQHPAICRAMAATSLLFELAMPLALFSRRARRVVVPGILAVQIGIAVLMGPDFLRFGFCYVFWVPWAALGRRARALLGTRPTHHFLYDGSCGICRSTVAVLARLDVLGRVRFHDALGQWPAIHAAFPALRQEDCLATMHVVTADGAVRTGFEAYRAISWSIPLLWPAAPLLYVPPVPFFGRRVYARVARSRHDAGCPVPERSAAP